MFRLATGAIDKALFMSSEPLALRPTPLFVTLPCFVHCLQPDKASPTMVDHPMVYRSGYTSLGMLRERGAKENTRLSKHRARLSLFIIWNSFNDRALRDDIMLAFQHLYLSLSTSRIYGNCPQIAFFSFEADPMVW